MRFRDSIFASLLKPIDRRWFQAVVDRLKGDAYDKCFKSWHHMVALIFAQLNGAVSLRGLIAAFNANAHHHYHLGVGRLARSTFADANARRPVEIFAQTFTHLSRIADRQTRREGTEMLRLIDSSPIPLGKTCDWATWNGRIRGLKLHVIHDPKADCPRGVAITPATVNDVEIGRTVMIEAGVTYGFDKAYCHFGWWRKIHENGAFFVTRPKKNMRFKTIKHRYVRKQIGDGFRVIDDREVVLASKGDSTLPIPLRIIKVRRDTGATLTFITNDLERTAFEIALLYKSRWQIELLFRWIKQHLDIRTFLGTNDNTIRLQILAAMIAYLLLRIAARLHRLTMPALRLAELVGQCLFIRKPLVHIDKPPPVNPSKARPKCSPDQLSFCYA